MVGSNLTFFLDFLFINSSFLNLNCTQVNITATVSVQIMMTEFAVEIPNNPMIVGIPPLAASKLFARDYMVVIHNCYTTLVVAASFLYGSYGHPQVQTVPSTAWVAPCPVVTPSLPGLARRFLQEQYIMPC